MLAPSYTLDADAAKEADSGGNRITESGAYLGMFTKAKHIVASTGALGIEFSFKSNEGQEANYLTIYTKNKEGKNIYGYKQLMAIMTCLGVRSLTPTDSNIMEYDFEHKKDVAKNVVLYPDLMNKPIGLVLQKELYTKSDGNDGERMGLYSFYNSNSKCTAAERLDNNPATAIDSMLRTLGDKDSRKASNASSDPLNGQNDFPPNHGNAAIDFDDDIPF